MLGRPGDLPMLLAAILLLQAAGGPATAPQEPAGDPARALLRRVVAAQLAEPAPPRVEGFRARLNIRERDEHRREFDLQVLYRREGGGRIRLRVEDARRGTVVEKGFDGRRYWLLDEDGRLHDLGGREYRQDRESLDEALDQAEELLLLLDLQGLAERARELRLFAEDGRQGIQGILDRRGRPWTFRLHLDTDLQPVRLDLLPPPEEEPAGAGAPAAAPELMRFVLLRPGVFEGRRMPRVIHQYLGDRPLPVRLLEVRALEWRQPPPPQALAAPSGRPEGSGDDR